MQSEITARRRARLKLDGFVVTREWSILELQLLRLFLAQPSSQVHSLLVNVCSFPMVVAEFVQVAVDFCCAHVGACLAPVRALKLDRYCGAVISCGVW